MLNANTLRVITRDMGEQQREEYSETNEHNEEPKLRKAIHVTAHNAKDISTRLRG